MRVVAFDPADSGLIASDQAFARREDTLSVLAKASVLTLSGRASTNKEGLHARPFLFVLCLRRD